MEHRYYLSSSLRDEPAPAEMPAWFDELSPEQQAVCGGHPGMGSVESDGEQARLVAPPRVALASTQEEAERWFFDTHGYLVIVRRPRSVTAALSQLLCHSCSATRCRLAQTCLHRLACTDLLAQADRPEGHSGSARRLATSDSQRLHVAHSPM